MRNYIICLFGLTNKYRARGHLDWQCADYAKQQNWLKLCNWTASVWDPGLLYLLLSQHLPACECFSSLTSKSWKWGPWSQSHRDKGRRCLEDSHHVPRRTPLESFFPRHIEHSYRNNFFLMKSDVSSWLEDSWSEFLLYYHHTSKRKKWPTESRAGWAE